MVKFFKVWDSTFLHVFLAIFLPSRQEMPNRDVFPLRVVDSPRSCMNLDKLSRLESTRVVLMCAVMVTLPFLAWFWGPRAIWQKTHYLGVLFLRRGGLSLRARQYMFYMASTDIFSVDWRHLYLEDFHVFSRHQDSVASLHHSHILFPFSFCQHQI